MQTTFLNSEKAFVELFIKKVLRLIKGFIYHFDF